MNALLNLVTMEEPVLIFLKATDANVLQAILELIVKKKDLIAEMTHVLNVQCVKTNLVITITLVYVALDIQELIVMLL